MGTLTIDQAVSVGKPGAGHFFLVFDYQNDSSLGQGQTVEGSFQAVVTNHERQSGRLRPWRGACCWRPSPAAGLVSLRVERATACRRCRWRSGSICWTPRTTSSPRIDRRDDALQALDDAEDAYGEDRQALSSAEQELDKAQDDNDQQGVTVGKLAVEEAKAHRRYADLAIDLAHDELDVASAYVLVAEAQFEKAKAEAIVRAKVKGASGRCSVRSSTRR